MCDKEKYAGGNALDEKCDSRLWQQLANAIQLRSAQDQVLWTIFGTFWAANVLLLIALFSDGHFPEAIVGIIISLFGIGLGLVWHIVQHRALGHITKYEHLMKRLEKKLDFPKEFGVSGINEDDYAQYVGQGIRARVVMPGSSMGALIIWAAFLFFFILMAACDRCHFKPYW